MNKALLAVFGFGVVSLISLALACLFGLNIFSYCIGYLVCAILTPLYFAFTFIYVPKNFNGIEK